MEVARRAGFDPADRTEVALPSGDSGVGQKRVCYAEVVLCVAIDSRRAIERIVQIICYRLIGGISRTDRLILGDANCHLLGNCIS